MHPYPFPSIQHVGEEMQFAKFEDPSEPTRTRKNEGKLSTKICKKKWVLGDRATKKWPTSLRD